MMILIRIALIYLIIGCIFGFIIATVIKICPDIVNNVKDRTMNLIYRKTIFYWPVYLVGSIKKSIIRSIRKEHISDQEVNNALLELQDILDEQK